MEIKENSRTKNASRNILFGLIYKCLNIIMPFITRTIMIYTLGTKFLGLNSLFTSILQVLNLAELGFSNAIIYSMYKPIAENDKTKIAILLNYYKKVYRVIGIVILVIGIMLLPFLKYFINGDYPDGINIYIIYIINLLNTCLTYFLFAYKNSLLTASQREDIISKISSYVLILQNILQIIILLVIKDYYCYIIVLPLCTIINNLYTAFTVNKKYKDIKQTKEKLELEQSLEIKKNIKGMILQKIGGVVLSNVDYIIISAFLGLTTLGIYTNYYYIITSLFAILAVITNSLKASVGNSIILESKEKNFRDLKKFNFMYLWIVSFCTISILCLYQNFIYLWVGQEMMLDMQIVFLFAIYFFIHKWFDMLYVYQEACGLWWENRFVPFIAAITNLTLNIILVQTIGLKGIIISTIVSVLFIYDTGYAIVLFKNYFNKKQMKEWLMQQFKYIVVTIIAAFLTFIICEKLFLEYSIINLILRGIVCLVIPNIIFLFCYMRQEECKEILKMVINIVKGLKAKVRGKIELKYINKDEKEFCLGTNLIELINKNINTDIDKVKEIEIDESNEIYKWVGAVRYNNKMYCIPNGINKFLVYDIKSGEYHFIPINQENKPFMWTGGCEFNEKIYAFPRTANTLLSLDLKTNEVEKINLGLKYRREHHYGGVQIKDGIIFQPPRDSNHILKIDIKNKIAKKIYILPKLLNMKYRYTSGILHPNNNIYFFPERDGRIMVLNIETEKISFIGDKISTMVFDAAIAEDGNIYGFSEHEEGILKIDVKNKTSQMIHKEIGVAGCYGSKLGINGKIYGIPGNGNKIYEYDIKNDIVKSVYEIEESTQAKCAGGIITSDGTIYTVPALGNKIYEYQFKEQKEEINEELLNSVYYTDNY